MDKTTKKDFHSMMEMNGVKKQETAFTQTSFSLSQCGIFPSETGNLEIRFPGNFDFMLSLCKCVHSFYI